MKSTNKNRKTNPYDLNDILKMRLNAVEQGSIEVHRKDPYSAVNINYKKTASKVRDRKR